LKEGKKGKEPDPIIFEPYLVHFFFIGGRGGEIGKKKGRGPWFFVPFSDARPARTGGKRKKKKKPEICSISS